MSDFNLVHAETVDYADKVAIRLGIKDGDERYVLKEAPLEKVHKHDYVSPSIVMPYEAAQRLLDELYKIGLRPRDGSSSLAHVQALENHLKDFRTIAFKQLKIHDS